MFFALVAMIGCLDYGELEDLLEEDGGKKGNGGGGGGARGEDEEETTPADAGGVGGRGDGDGDGDGDNNHEDEVGGTGVDETCALGVSAFCVCAEAYGYPCSDDDMQAFYVQCVEGSDQGLFECMADFVEDGLVYCYDAIPVCLAEYM